MPLSFAIIGWQSGSVSGASASDRCAVSASHLPGRSLLHFFKKPGNFFSANCCRSPSMEITTSPRAKSKPALSAGVWPNAAQPHYIYAAIMLKSRTERGTYCPYFPQVRVARHGVHNFRLPVELRNILFIVERNHQRIPVGASLRILFTPSNLHPRHLCAQLTVTIYWNLAK
jgi:hypothetical protein